jgi:beta-glucosidase
MVNLITDGRLPQFTEEERQMVQGSFDYLGLNHYASKYAKWTGKPGRYWDNDGRYEVSDYNVKGELIGEYAESHWLTVYPQGIRDMLTWI